MTKAPVSESAVDTRARLLDAAERLFAARGIVHTTMRQITAAAGANVAAVNYHFGSKQTLIEEVFARRIRPVNEERLSLLDAVERESADAAPDLRDILHALVAPPFLLWGADETALDFIRLMGRAHTEPSEDIRQLVFAQFEEVIMCFSLAIARALPDLSPREIHWRLHFAVGAMAFTMANHDLHWIDIGVEYDVPETDEQILQRLVSFLAAGFRGELRASE